MQENVKNADVAENVGTQYYFSQRQKRGFAVIARDDNRDKITLRFVDGKEYTATSKQGEKPKKEFVDHVLVETEGPGIITKNKVSVRDVLNEIDRSN